jgi:eukaryotic-like serine/threonine-protein kinase
MTADAELLRRVSTLFDELHELPAESRARWLQELQAVEPRAAAELARWLEKDAQSQGALDSLPEHFQAATTAAPDTPSDRSGQRIGAYALLRRVGRGGMGEVYEAHRPGADFEQKVAIKLLRRGLDSEDIVRRFLRERRILAQLEHPGIARLIDGDLSDDGLPYLVMEFVDGSTLMDAANARTLDLDARLNLFLQICDAVAYAHRRLIVHRDLKPSNVLLAADNQPKLLDFGIAKLLDEVDDDHLTRTGMRVLTPGYAAPEQILGQPISTATDVYALGVMLYELLTGLSPHQRRGKDLDRVSRDLDQESLVRPSEALLNTGEARDATQTQRQRLARQLSGDIDTIVLHALKREPDRRYQGAAELAEDIRRHLNGHPVRAETDTMTYRMRKFISRHRGGVTAAALALLGIMAGLGIALWQAEVAREQAVRADVEAHRATVQATRAEHVKDFVLALFREQNPLTRDKARAATAGELVARGIAEARREFASDIQTQAEIVGELATLQFNLGDVKQSVPHLQSALALHEQSRGRDSTEYAATLSTLGAARLALGETDKAADAIASSLATLRKSAGPDSLQTALAETRQLRFLLLQDRIAEALTVAQHAHAVYARELGALHRNTLQGLYNLGGVFNQLDRLNEAEQTYRQVIAGYEKSAQGDHAALVYPRLALARMLKDLHRYEESAEYFTSALDAASIALDAEHPMIGQISMHLGDLHRRRSRYAEAEQAWQVAERIFSRQGSAELGMISIYRGALAMDQRRFDVAVRHYERAVQRYGKVLGTDSGFAQSAALRLAKARAASGDSERAVREGSVVHQAMKAAAEPGTFDEFHAYEAWAEVLFEAGKLSDSEAMFRKALDLQQASNGSEGMDAAVLEWEIAETLYAQEKNPSEALNLIGHAVRIIQANDARDPNLGEALLLRGKLLRQSGAHDAAVDDWKLAHGILLAAYGGQDHRVMELADFLRQ